MDACQQRSQVLSLSEIYKEKILHHSSDLCFISILDNMELRANVAFRQNKLKGSCPSSICIELENKDH